MNSKKKVGRPTEKPMPIRVGFRMDPKALEKLDLFCIKKGMRRSDVIREAIQRYISE